MTRVQRAEEVLRMEKLIEQSPDIKTRFPGTQKLVSEVTIRVFKADMKRDGYASCLSIGREDVK